MTELKSQTVYCKCCIYEKEFVVERDFLDKVEAGACLGVIYSQVYKNDKSGGEFMVRWSVIGNKDICVPCAKKFMLLSLGVE